MQDQYLISLSDCWQLLYRQRRKLLVATLTCSLLMSYFGLRQSTVYEAEASFRDAGDKAAGVSLGQILRGSSASGSSAASLMRSRKLNYPIIDELCLQVKIKSQGDQRGFLSQAWRNWQLQRSYWKKAESPPFNDTPTRLICTAVSYEGETSRSFKLRMKDSSHYEVYLPEKGKWLSGELAKSLDLGYGQITLVKAAEAPRKRDKYTLTLLPREKIATTLANKTKIETDKADSSLLHISFVDEDRHFAAKYLNTLMAGYKRYLQDESDGYAEKQADYLRKKDQDSYEQLLQTLSVHVEKISAGMSQSGFPSAEKLLEFLTCQQEEYHARLLEIDLELETIQRLLKTRLTDVESYALRFSANGLLAISAQWNDLRQRLDMLKANIAEHHIKRTNVRQEFCGIDLDTASKLFFDYNRELHDLEGSLQQCAYVLQQMDQPDFAISSISSVMGDPILSQVVSKTSRLQLDLSDEPNRTGKEQQRIEDELNLQRHFLRRHVTDSHKLLGLKQEVTEANIYSLQDVIAKLLSQKIEVLEKHILAYLRERQLTLKQERQILSAQVESIKKEMATLPKRWSHERVMDLQVSQSEHILNESAKLVEAQTIDHNLKVFMAGPVDQAYPVLMPESPKLGLWSLLGAFGGLASMSLSLLLSAVIRGVRASPGMLRNEGETVCGTLSADLGDPLSNQDLETLRHLSLCWEQRQRGAHPMALLALGSGPDYSTQLAELLAARGQSVLLISADFQKPDLNEEGPSLLDALTGQAKAPKIDKTADYHKVCSSGCSRIGLEKLCSPAYVKLLDMWSQDYSCLLLVLPGAITGAAAANLSLLAELCSYTITEENCEDVIPLCASDNSQSRAFLFSTPRC